jgi:Fe-S-cluster containining protein
MRLNPEPIRKNGCRGLCCQRFPIGISPHSEVLKFLEKGKQFEEYRKISEMLILISDEEQAIYTCKHFNMETRLCTNYPNRPDMCKDYPYNKVCYYCWLSAAQSENKILCV